MKKDKSQIIMDQFNVASKEELMKLFAKLSKKTLVSMMVAVWLFFRTMEEKGYMK